LRRYTQAYFSKYIKAPQPGKAQSGIASAHDRVKVKHEIAPQELEPDATPRKILADFRVTGDGLRSVVSTYALVSVDAAKPEASLIAQAEGWQIEKRLRLNGECIETHYRFAGENHERFDVELNLAMPSCDGYTGRYVLENGDMPCGFGQALDLTGCTRLTLDDRVLAGGIVIETSSPVAIKGRPHFTVSQSEGGLEKIMQSACITLSWLVPDEGSELRVTLRPYGDVSTDAGSPKGLSRLWRWFAAVSARGARQPRT